MAETLQVGQQVQFTYHNKERRGTVDTVRQTCFVVKLDNDDEGKQYKGFKYSKVENLTILS